MSRRRESIGRVLVSLELLVVALAGASLLGTNAAWAETPHRINYQGVLADKATGEAILGSVDIEFALYGSPAGGTAEWSETQTVTPDSNGIFSVILGSEVPIVLGFEGPMWLELTVSGEALEPRREIVSVPYAFRATYVDSAYWTGLRGVPDGFSDSVDDVGPGDGYSLDASDGDPADAVYVDGDGRVGIGTAAPARKLHVAGDGARVLVEATGGNAEINLATSGDAPGDVWAIYKHVTDGDLHFFRGGDRVTVQSATGNVGIGTAHPAVKLDVAGAVNATSEYMIGGNTVLAARDTSNLLVGYAAGAKTLGTFSVCIGDSAGYSFSGDRCAFVGFAAGRSNAFSDNTFVGYRAGYANQSGYLNTFIGSSAGAKNESGPNNTFIGAAAGTKNTTGQSNTFVGEGAGYDNVDGWANTFVGRLAGMSDIGGSKNSFYGNYAGWSNESGNNNTYIGEEAGQYNKTGSGNVLLGCQAGFHELGSNKLYIANGPDTSDVLIYGDFSNGRIGLGTATPERKLHILGDGPRILIESTGGSPEINFENTDDTSIQRWAIYKHPTADDLRFYQNGDRVTIRSGTGNVGIGTIDPGSYKLYVNGSACGTSAWGTCSDARYKRDIRDISGALSKVLGIRGVSFEWRREDFADKGFSAGRHYGVIAQEVERVLPEVVASGPEGAENVTYDEIIPVLIESVKELKAQNDILEERIALLEKALSEARPEHK